LFAQLVSKIFNLCGPDPPTSQTHGQTDGQTTCDCDRALHYSASCGKNANSAAELRLVTIFSVPISLNQSLPTTLRWYSCRDSGVAENIKLQTWKCETT